MKQKLMLMVIGSVMMCSSIANSQQIQSTQQQEAIRQLDIARSELSLLRSIIPQFLQRIVGQHIGNIEDRVVYAQQILLQTQVAQSYFCVVKSSFDGDFTGRGLSELEAKHNALASCQLGSRSKGFFCDEKKIQCSN